MDREAFFALLTDEAAAPDPKFIRKLRKQVIKASGGGILPGSPNMIVAGVITAATAGVIGFALLQSDNPAPLITSDTSDQADVETQTPQSSNQPNANSAAEDVDDENTDSNDVAEDDPQTADEPTQDSNASDNDPQTPDPTPTPPTTPSNIPFTVKFWNYAKGATPVVQDDTPDYQVTVGDRLDFDWGIESPGGAVGEDLFVAQAVATQYLDPGDYVINMNINDGVRVFVNGVMVYERWQLYGGEIDQAEFSVGSDPETEIVIEYFEEAGEAVFKAEIVAN